MLLFIEEYVKGFTLTNLLRFNISLNAEELIPDTVV